MVLSLAAFNPTHISPVIDLPKYTTSLTQGQGLIPETMALLEVWSPGMTAKELTSLSIEKGILSKATARRVRNIILEQFGPRYLVDEGAPASNLKLLLRRGLSSAELKQLCMIYTSRANLIFHDFITNVYWQKYQAGSLRIGTEDAAHFINVATAAGYMSPQWAESTSKRVANYLVGTLADFGLVDSGRKSIRDILLFEISPLTSLYLAHEIHFSGQGDDALAANTDWRLFGLDPTDVVRELQLIAREHFIVQSAGDLVRISWKYEDMEEALNAIVASEL